jgi:predicted nucleotidyltransferase
MRNRRSRTVAEQQALEHFKTTLESLLADNLVSLRLFGSRARHEGTKESDLDVLVVLRKKDRAVCRRIVAEALEVDLAYGTNLAPTILSTEEYQQNREYQTPFYRNLERESLPL